jgi:hypothetical protein
MNLDLMPANQLAIFLLLYVFLIVLGISLGQKRRKP